jgi:hypothetical protein
MQVTFLKLRWLRYPKICYNSLLHRRDWWHLPLLRHPGLLRQIEPEFFNQIGMPLYTQREPGRQ